MSSAFRNLENIIASILQNCTVIPIYKLVCNLAVTVTTQETKKEKQNLKKKNPTGYLSRENIVLLSAPMSHSVGIKSKNFISQMSHKTPYIANPHYTSLEKRQFKPTKSFI